MFAAQLLLLTAPPLILYPALHSEIRQRTESVLPVAHVWVAQVFTLALLEQAVHVKLFALPAGLVVPPVHAVQLDDPLADELFEPAMQAVQLPVWVPDS